MLAPDGATSHTGAVCEGGHPAKQDPYHFLADTVGQFVWAAELLRV